MSEPALDAIVGHNGSLHIPADDLAAHGVGPGDRVRVLRVGNRKIRSMLGAYTRDVGFTDEHLRELRRDMAEGIGEDLTR